VDEAFRAALAKHPGARPRDVEAWAEGLASDLEGLPARGNGWVFPPPGGPLRKSTATTVITARSPG
jgi:hypothetical protein